MSTKKSDIIISCPHCKVCSIKLTADEFTIIEAGQQMVDVCQVCGKEVYLGGFGEN